MFLLLLSIVYFGLIKQVYSVKDFLKVHRAGAIIMALTFLILFSTATYNVYRAMSDLSTGPFEYVGTVSFEEYIDSTSQGEVTLCSIKLELINKTVKSNIDQCNYISEFEENTEFKIRYLNKHKYLLSITKD